MSPRRLVIDCDPGNGIPGADIDDGLAIALALSAPHLLSLEMITVVSGNTHRDQGYSVARTLLDRAGVDLPVYAGASSALVEPSGPWRVRQDANSSKPEILQAWADVRPPDRYDAASALGAAVRLVELVREHPGEVTVVAIGPLTNIAHAIQLEPGFAGLVGEIVIMGGAFNVPGFLQELNFGIDPEAAQVVLSSGARITLVPLDATSQTLMTHADLDRLDPASSALAGYLVETTRPWIDLAAAWRNIDGCLLHDPLAVALLIDPSIAEYSEQIVGVELRGGLTRSRPIAWTEQNLRLHVGLDLPPHTSTVRVVTVVDNQKLLNVLFDSYASWSDPTP